jgi:ParB family chromosome partitioning protein
MTTTYLPEVRLSLIEPHGANPRRSVGNVADLTASISEHGLLEPLVLAPLNGTQYRLIAGHRRLAAAKRAGLATVPAMLREDLDTPAKQLAAMLVENTQRADLTAVEEAHAYAQLVAFPGMTQAKAAKATGRSTKTVRSRLALAKLPEKTLEKVHTGQVTLAEAETLVEFVGTPEYDGLARQVGGSNFTWAVERARETANIRVARELVEKACAERGWATAERRDAGASVLSSWEAARIKTAEVESLLDGLDGPHFFVEAGGGWMLCAPSVLEQDDDEDELPPDTPEEAARRAEAEERIAQREQRDADLETARTVRAGWLHGRLDKLLVKDEERAPLLRLLVEDWIHNSDYDESVATYLGMPPVPEDANAWDEAVVDARRDWAGDLSEHQAWKALLALSFDVIRCGSTWDDSHIPSIRVATALGYEPSDFETALIAPITPEESTA